MKTVKLIALCLLAAAAPLAAEEPSVLDCPGVIALRNANAVAAAFPDAGGRVVFYGFPGGANALKCDAKLLSGPIPEPSAEAKHFPLNGHEVWPAPQEDFWRFQDLNAGRRERAESWPPDPWLATGRFALVERSASKLVLQGPPSPISGLQFKKSMELLPDGSLKLEAEAVNCRTSPVEWGLWSNTRLDGSCRFYASCKTGTVRVDARFWSPETERILQFKALRGFFSFLPPEGIGDGERAVGKAFFEPGEGELYAFGDSFLFIKSFPLTPKAQLRKSQSPVEVYQELWGGAKSGLLELEFHGPCRKLMPGESMAISETWRLVRCPKLATETERLDFLEALPRGSSARR